MSTYSNGAGYPINADKLQDLNSVLHELPDNTNHYISPKYVRDAIYTTWENVIFKPTTIPSSVVEYVGIDQISFAEKILLGRKQSSSGQYVLSNDLLNSNGDIFLYNTTTGSNTTLVFLAGTGSNFYNGNIFAPTITAQVVDTISDGKYLDLNITNNTWVNYTTPYGGNININSQYGFINLNSINIPTNAQNLAANVGNVLSISSISGGNIYLQWSTVTGSSTGGATAVYYTNSTPVPQTIGGILAGSTFSNVPIQDIITRLLYPYLPPTLNLSLSTYFVEIGAPLSNLILNYTIGRNATYSLTGTPVTSGGISGLPSYPSLSSISYLSSVTSTSSVLFTNNATVFTGAYGSNTFTMSVHDTKGIYVTSSVTVNTVLPWYWGTSYMGITGAAMPLGKTASLIVPDFLTPLLTTPATQSVVSNNKTLPFTGQNKYVYFGYPSSFPYLEQILDGNGFDITGSFRTYSVSLNSPNLGYWSGRLYTFYIYSGPSGPTLSTTTLGSIFNGYSENLSFLFATAS
jgi:hypothetical protein